MAFRDWINGLRFRFRLWLDSFEPCPKEQRGYTCRHRVMSNGKMECGDKPE